jgi:serine/threonine protein kinase
LTHRRGFPFLECHALQLIDLILYLHQKKVLVRDIRPSNLMVHDGQLVLVDFGFACAAGACIRFCFSPLLHFTDLLFSPFQIKVLPFCLRETSIMRPERCCGN